MQLNIKSNPNIYPSHYLCCPIIGLNIIAWGLHELTVFFYKLIQPYVISLRLSSLDMLNMIA